MAKSKNKIRVNFCGQNAHTVTGSCTHIQMDNCQILLEIGLFQGKNSYEDYKINKRRFNFKPKNIDFIFIGHSHIDHIGLLPRLYKEGCKARIIVPKGVLKLFSVMGADSAFIMSKDVEFFEKKYGKRFEPIYTQTDVDNCLQYFEEYGFDEKIRLTEDVEFCFQPSGHIICAAQTELWLNQNNHTKKIVYTSDLGNSNIPKYYIEGFKPVDKASLLIAESTYSDKRHSVNLKDRDKDLEKIKSVIDTTCLDSKCKVLIPVFALDRLQNILTHLYNLFGTNRGFNIPVLIDTPLGIKLCDLYKELLQGKQLEQFNEVMNWKNIIFVKDYEDSKFYMKDNNPYIIISCGGMLQAGRSRTWVSKLLPSSKNHILFCGFSAIGSLSDKIKNGNQKTITIDGVVTPNRCNITDLRSFSSHISRDGMLKYYSDINAEKIALVHGDSDSKIELAKDLRKEISNKNKSGRVICVNKGTEISL